MGSSSNDRLLRHGHSFPRGSSAVALAGGGNFGDPASSSGSNGNGKKSSYSDSASGATATAKKSHSLPDSSLLPLCCLNQSMGEGPNSNNGSNNGSGDSGTSIANNTCTTSVGPPLSFYHQSAAAAYAGKPHVKRAKAKTGKHERGTGETNTRSLSADWLLKKRISSKSDVDSLSFVEPPASDSIALDGPLKGGRSVLLVGSKPKSKRLFKAPRPRPQKRQTSKNSLLGTIGPVTNGYDYDRQTEYSCDADECDTGVGFRLERVKMLPLLHLHPAEAAVSPVTATMATTAMTRSPSSSSYCDAAEDIDCRECSGGFGSADEDESEAMEVQIRPSSTGAAAATAMRAGGARGHYHRVAGHEDAVDPGGSGVSNRVLIWGKT